LLTRLRSAVDVRPAEWVVVGLRGFGQSVLSLVPDGFPAYVRVFHPAYRQEGVPAFGIPVRWAKIAAANGKQAHPGMQLGALTDSYDTVRPSQPGIFDHAPDVGRLSFEIVAALAASLARHTTTPNRCWFAFWEGFGGLPGDIRDAPTFSAPNRTYHLLSGPIEAAPETAGDPLFQQSPNLWWPDDHAWCVATEIDLNSTYIACDETCRDEIVALNNVEALPIDPATGISFRSDLLNPLDEPTESKS
jgi:hypothetical protein